MSADIEPKYHASFGCLRAVHFVAMFGCLVWALGIWKNFAICEKRHQFYSIIAGKLNS